MEVSMGTKILFIAIVLSLVTVRPSAETFGSGLSNETVLETSYKFQLSQNFSLMPDVQVVFNPAYDTSENSVWVFSLRAILSL